MARKSSKKIPRRVGKKKTARATGKRATRNKWGSWKKDLPRLRAIAGTKTLRQISVELGHTPVAIQKVAYANGISLRLKAA